MFYFKVGTLIVVKLAIKPYYTASIGYTSKYHLNLEIGGTPTAFCGTLGFRGTLVENHWVTRSLYMQMRSKNLQSRVAHISNYIYEAGQK